VAGARSFWAEESEICFWAFVVRKLGPDATGLLCWPMAATGSSSHDARSSFKLSGLLRERHEEACTWGRGRIRLKRERERKRQVFVAAMARRRRKVKIKNPTSLLLALAGLSLLLASSASAWAHLHQQQRHHPSPSQQQAPKHQHHEQHHEQELQQQQQPAASSQAPPSGAIPAGQLCALLPVQLARQVKLCKLISHSPEADRAVSSGASSGLAECRSQLRSERWNCTHPNGDHQLLTGELTQSVGNRESGLVHAIAAAGIVHSVAAACSKGALSDCACDKTRTGLIRRQEENWKWGGCSNNIRHGMVFAKHLVELLDALHLHQRHSARAHKLGKRSLWSEQRNELANSVRGRHKLAAQREAGEQQQQQQLGASFCQRNQNISQATHFQLIKSLLSKDSLERHQEFRLAMNMHNNKVGRMVSSEF